MNHIYKVIWNHAKHCYTVVSEIAKSHSTSSVTKKKVSIAAILAAGMLSGFSPMVSGAADTTNSEAVVYDQNQTSLKSTNSGRVGKNAIALGKRASAVDESIAIGNGAYTQNGTLTYGQSVALGNGAVTGAKSTSIGNNAKGGREGTITIGANAKNEVLYATIVGTDSTITSDGTAYMLDLPILGEKPVNVQGAVSTSYGAHNTITNEKEVFSGVANSIIGSVNTVTNSNGVTIQGTGNTVTGAYKNMNLNDSDFRKLFLLGDYSVLKEKESGAIAIIGGANTISSQTSSTVIGFGNTLKGENSTGVFTAGSHNTLTNVSNSLVMGDNNTLENQKNVISLGNENTVKANDAVAIGNGTTVKAKSGVAIGVGSVADRVAGSEKGALGAFAPDTIPKAEESTWRSTAGAVSVGYTVGDITRQITNVAAGSEDTDAVNVAQLKQVAGQAEKANQGWNLSTNGETTAATNVAPGGSVDFSGDDNVSVSNKETKVTVALNKDVKLNSATFGDTVINASGLTIGGGTSGLEFSKNRVSVGGLQIHDVADGKDDMDAVNVSQLKKQTAASKTTVSDGINTTVTSTVAEDGHTDYKVNLNKDLTGIESISNGSKGQSKIVLNEAYTGMAYGDTNVVLMDNGVYLNGKVNVDKAGQIHNVTAGTADEDAVNVSQLKKQAAASKTTVSDGTNTTVTSTVAEDGHTDYKVNLNKDLTGIESMTNGLSSIRMGNGGTVTINNRVTIDQSGKISGVAAGEVKEGSTDAVNGSQLKQVASQAERANQGWNLSTNGVATAATNVAPGGYVDFSGDDNVSVSNKETKVKVALNKDVQLNSATFEDTVINAKGLTIGGGTSGLEFSKNRVSVGGQQIHDVADGKDDMDAVNMSQLKKQTAASKTTVSDGTNTTVTSTVAKDGHTDYKVNLNKDLTGIESISNGSKGQSKIVLNEAYTGMAYGDTNVVLLNNGVYLNGKVNVDKAGQIHNVTAGTADEDAVNVSQLKAVGTTANMGWNLATNGVATEATNVKPGDFVDFSGDKNISVSHDGTKVQVELNKDIDVNYVQTNALNAKYNLSVGTANENGIMPFFVNSAGDFYAAHNKFHVDKDGKVTATAGEIGNVVLQNGVYYGHSTLQDGNLLLTDDNGNHSYIDAKSAKLGKVTVAEDGKISGVAAGAVTADSTDAVNGSQLHAVATEAGKHSKVVNGSNINVEETDVDGQKIYKVGLNDDILLGKLTGNNVSISGTNGTIETTGYIATKDRIIADKGAQLADITVSGNAISNGEAKVALDGAAGTAGMMNGKGASLYMQDGTTVINNKVGIDQEGKITGVAAGKISADSTDAVNGSQLHEVATEAGKHSKVVNGSNINVEETDVDGQKIYKVGLNDDILLGKLTGNNVSISGTNGTIETTGYIATKDRIIADKGAQLADITVSGNAISNGEAKVALDGAAGTAGMINGKGASLYMQDGTTVINNKVGIDQEGKITGVAAGEISATSKDAVNGSQLKQTNDKVDALDKRVTQNEADIKQNKADIALNKANIQKNTVAIEQNKTDIATNKENIATNKENINKLDTRVTNVEELAKKHTTVAAGDNITVTEGTNKDGGKNYTVAMKKDITVDSVKAGDTTINTEGVRIGDTTSLKKDSLTIGGKTYVTDKGLNANDQKVTNVAAGDISEKSTDAINGSQLFATNQQVAQNAQSINKLGNRINKVGAGAAALAALHPLDFDPDDKWDFAAGYGNYNGENAAAIGAYYRPNEDTMFSVGGSFGNGENMVNAGVSLKLGQGNHVSTSKVAMAKEIKDLRKELEGLKSALLDVNAGKKLDTSKLQLFPDVPKNHWAYEYVSTLKGNGVLTGYSDGEFKGDRPMTRYEFATMLYKAMLEGVTLSDKILKEFAPELERFTVDTVHQDKDGKPTVERVRTVKAEK